MSGSLRFYLVVVAALAATAAACRGSHSSSPSAALGGPCTNDATQEAIRAVPFETRVRVEPGSTSVAYLVPDDEITCRIRRVMLTLGDLPKGWKVSRLGAGGFGGRLEPGGRGPCNVPYAYLTGGVDQAFESEAGTTPLAATPPGREVKFIAERVAVFDHGAASQVMSAVRRSCQFLPATSAAGEGTPADDPQSHYRLVSIPAIGDESIMYSSDFVGIPDYEALIRHGDLVLQVSFVGAGVTPDELSRVAKIADVKIVPQMDYLLPTAIANLTPTPTLDPNSRQAILESALPTADELPRGWIPGRSSSADDMRILRFCTSAPVLPPRQRGASASYRGPALGPGNAALDIGIMSFAPQDADTVMRQVIDGSAFPDGCAGSVRNINVTWSVKRLDVPALGNGGAAWEAVAQHTAAAGPTDTPLTSDIQVDFEVFRRGNLIGLVIELRQEALTSLFDDEAKSDMTSFGGIVDAKLKAIQDKVPPG